MITEKHVQDLNFELADWPCQIGPKALPQRTSPRPNLNPGQWVALEAMCVDLIRLSQAESALDAIGYDLLFKRSELSELSVYSLLRLSCRLVHFAYQMAFQDVTEGFYLDPSDAR